MKRLLLIVVLAGALGERVMSAQESAGPKPATGETQTPVILFIDPATRKSDFGKQVARELEESGVARIVADLKEAAPPESADFLLTLSIRSDEPAENVIRLIGGLRLYCVALGQPRFRLVLETADSRESVVRLRGVNPAGADLEETYRPLLARALLDQEFVKFAWVLKGDERPPSPFLASLVVVRADWADVSAANRIDAELREALKETSVPPRLLERLPASGAAILFPQDMVALYSSQHFAEFFAWLQARGLVSSSERFPKVTPGFLDEPEVLGHVQVAPNRPAVELLVPTNHFATSLLRGDEFLPVPAIVQFESKPFVSRQARLEWKVYSDAELLVVDRKLAVGEQFRGQPTTEGLLTYRLAALQTSLPPGHVAVVQAFPGQAGDQNDPVLSRAAVEKGAVALLVIESGNIPTSAQPRLHLPDRIQKPLVGRGQRIQWQNLPRGWLGATQAATPAAGRGGARRTQQPTERPEENEVTSMRELKHAGAAEAAEQLRSLVPSATFLVLTEKGLNSIVYRCPESVVPAVEQALAKLDEGPAAAAEGLEHPQAVVVFHDASMSKSERLRAEYEASEEQARGIVQQIRSLPAADARVSKFRGALRDAVASAFAVRQRLLKAELTEFEQRITRLRQSIEGRERTHDRIIDRRVEELLNGDLEWKWSAKPFDGSARVDTPTKAADAPKRATALREHGSDASEPEAPLYTEEELNDLLRKDPVMQRLETERQTLAARLKDIERGARGAPTNFREITRDKLSNAETAIASRKLELTEILIKRTRDQIEPDTKADIAEMRAYAAANPQYAVVGIELTIVKADTAGDEVPSTAYCSGVVVSDDGLIAVSLLRDARSERDWMRQFRKAVLLVPESQSQIAGQVRAESARLVAYDPQSGLALLKAELPVRNGRTSALPMLVPDADLPGNGQRLKLHGCRVAGSGIEPGSFDVEVRRNGVSAQDFNIVQRLDSDQSASPLKASFRGAALVDIGGRLRGVFRDAADRSGREPLWSVIPAKAIVDLIARYRASDPADSATPPATDAVGAPEKAGAKNSLDASADPARAVAWVEVTFGEAVARRNESRLTVYRNGVVVSEDGLVAIALDRDDRVQEAFVRRFRSASVFFASGRAELCRLVAWDAASGFALLKAEFSDTNRNASVQFPMLAIDPDLPGAGQELALHGYRRGVGGRDSYAAMTPVEVVRTEDGGFRIRTDGKHPTARPLYDSDFRGAAIVDGQGRLRGLLDEAIPQASTPDRPGAPYVQSSVIPAKSIADLLMRYRQRLDGRGAHAPAEPTVTVLQLRKHDVTATAESIKALFANQRASEAPIIEADTQGRRLLIRGTPGQIKQIRELLRKMGEDDLDGLP